MKTRTMLVLCTLSVAAIASAQEGDISFKSTELAPGLYMLEGQGGFTGGNLGLITGDDGQGDGFQETDGASGRRDFFVHHDAWRPEMVGAQWAIPDESRPDQ